MFDVDFVLRVHQRSIGKRLIGPSTTSWQYQQQQLRRTMFREGGHTTAIVSGGRRKLHTTFEDGAELIEEYDVSTGELLVRKRRGKTVLGRQADWEYLVGDAPVKWNPEAATLKESSENPIFSRKDTRDAFQWRVRNLPYPPDTYSVTVEPGAKGEGEIVIRTSNKKYFKRIQVLEMSHLSLPLTPAALSWAHANNTLVVSYAKPAVVMQAEAKAAEEAAKIRAQQEGDVDCKQQ